MQGGGTIYNVEPEIRIDFYRSKIRNPSNGWVNVFFLYELLCLKFNILFRLMF